MLSRYDTTQQGMVDCEFVRRHDTTQNAWVDCEFARAYDTTQNAWVDKLDLDNYFTEYAFSLLNGGSYTVSEDKRTITFNFKSSSYGTVDSASLVWKGKAVTNGILLGETASSDPNTNPDVYFYYDGQQVKSSKLKTNSGDLIGIYCEGLTVDEIVINIVPYNASTFSIINPHFGKALKFEIDK